MQKADDLLGKRILLQNGQDWLSGTIMEKINQVRYAVKLDSEESVPSKIASSKKLQFYTLGGRQNQKSIYPYFPMGIDSNGYQSEG